MGHSIEMIARPVGLSMSAVSSTQRVVQPLKSHVLGLDGGTLRKTSAGSIVLALRALFMHAFQFLAFWVRAPSSRNTTCG